ncbi:MAG: PEP-CTERM sorting domain-containing protein [Planctomycetota bacterium]
MKHLLTAAAAATLIAASSASAQTVTGSLGAFEFAAIEIEVSGGTTLVIDTIGSTNAGFFGNDTELGLYDGVGPSATLIASNDDFGSFGDGETESLLDFGVDSPIDTDLVETGPYPGDGVYTVVVGPFNTVFGGTLGEVEVLDDLPTEFVVNFDSDGVVTVAVIPEPASLGLLSVAGLGLIRRRRA